MTINASYEGTITEHWAGDPNSVSVHIEGDDKPPKGTRVRMDTVVDAKRWTTDGSLVRYSDGAIAMLVYENATRGVHSPELAEHVVALLNDEEQVLGQWRPVTAPDPEPAA